MIMMDVSYATGRIKDHLDRKKNPYLLYEAIATIGLATKAFGGNYSPTGDAVLIFDALLFVFNYDFTPYWPK